MSSKLEIPCDGKEYSVYYEDHSVGVFEEGNIFVPEKFDVAIEEIVNADSMVRLRPGPRWNRVAKVAQEFLKKEFFAKEPNLV